MKIVLIGFMGTGKSTVAQVLVKRLDTHVIEMDDLIVKKAGMSIEEIFEIGGEELFRKYESKVCADLRDTTKGVISTGGGVVMRDENVKNLKKNSLIVALTASFETVLKRINPKIPRPLFENKEKAKALYDLRKALYNKYADFEISTDDKKVDEVVEDIVVKIK